MSGRPEVCFGKLQALQSKWRFIIRLHSTFPLAIVLLAFGSLFRSEVHAQANSTHPKTKLDSSQGQQVFVTVCAGCHGLDGRGAEHAPNIVNNPKLQGFSDNQISAIVSNGVPETAMPPFRSLGAPGIKNVVAYLRRLQGSRQQAALRGDPLKGKSIFFGNAGCSTCHMAEAVGGFLGPELSEYAGNHSSEEARSAITDPAENTTWRKTDLVAVTVDGQSISGIARNQDNFSVQLQTPNGDFYFFQKSQLRCLEHQPKPVMPSDYASTLSREEIDHLVSYLMSMAGGKKRDHGYQDND